MRDTVDPNRPGVWLYPDLSISDVIGRTPARRIRRVWIEPEWFIDRFDLREAPPRGDAHCVENPDAFFPDRDNGPQSYAMARRICDHCPLLQPCAEWAVEHGVVDGMWGGLTPSEIKYERARRKRERRAA